MRSIATTSTSRPAAARRSSRGRLPYYVLASTPLLASARVFPRYRARIAVARKHKLRKRNAADCTHGRHTASRHAGTGCGGLPPERVLNPPEVPNRNGPATIAEPELDGRPFLFGSWGGIRSPPGRLDDAPSTDSRHAESQPHTTEPHPRRGGLPCGGPPPERLLDPPEVQIKEGPTPSTLDLRITWGLICFVAGAGFEPATSRL